MSEKILLIDENGKKSDITLIEEAEVLANHKSLDLVCVDEEKAVYKLVDMSRTKYKTKKKQKQVVQKTKEVKFGISIAKHDKDIKIKSIDNFLNKKFKVKVTIEKPKRSPFKDKDIQEFLNNILNNISCKFEKDSKISFNGKTTNITIRPI